MKTASTVEIIATIFEKNKIISESTVINRSLTLTQAAPVMIPFSITAMLTVQLLTMR